MSDNLLFEVKDKVAVMTLNRPEALNAFTPEILTGWVRRLEEAQRRDSAMAMTPVVMTH
jgi:enoyl-CoA hydratase/carnithine racemase